MSPLLQRVMLWYRNERDDIARTAAMPTLMNIMDGFRQNGVSM
jgi:hypothetical protein